jgi:hypothetical protein
LILLGYVGPPGGPMGSMQGCMQKIHASDRIAYTEWVCHTTQH